MFSLHCSECMVLGVWVRVQGARYTPVSLTHSTLENFSPKGTTVPAFLKLVDVSFVIVSVSGVSAPVRPVGGGCA